MSPRDHLHRSSSGLTPDTVTLSAVLSTGNGSCPSHWSKMRRIREEEQ